MKKENTIAIEQLSKLRSMVKASQKYNDESAVAVREEAMNERGKLRLRDKIDIADYEGGALADFSTGNVIDKMILELVAE